MGNGLHGSLPDKVTFKETKGQERKQEAQVYLSTSRRRNGIACGAKDVISMRSCGTPVHGIHTGDLPALHEKVNSLIMADRMPKENCSRRLAPPRCVERAR